MHGDDGGPFGAEPAQALKQCVFGLGVHPGEGLVEQQQVRLLSEGAGEEHPLLLAAGELSDRAVGERAESELVQAAVSLHPVPAMGLAAARPGREQPVESSSGAHLDDLKRGHGEVPVHRLALRHVGDPRASVGEGLPPEERLAGERAERADGGVEER